MSIKIEIIKVEETRVVAAFYFPVPQAQHLPASADPSRMPLGSRLSAQELQDLKAGNLIELMIQRARTPGQSLPSIQTTLEGLYQQQSGPALAKYRRQFGGSDLAWDGTSWS